MANLAVDRGELELADTILDAAGLLESATGQRLQDLRRERACVEYEQERLRSEAEKWSMAFLVSPDPVLMVRVPDAVILEANEAFHSILGYSKEDIAGRTSAQVGMWTSCDDRARMLEALDAAGVSYNLETTLRRRDGTTLTVLISARRMKLGTSEVVVSNIRDISTLKAAENELKRERTRLLHIQEQAGLGTWVYRPGHNAVEWSQQAFRLAGMDPNGPPPTFDEYVAILHPEDRPFLLNAVEQALKDGKPYSLRVRHSLPDGSCITVLAAGIPHVIDGRVVELFGSVLDINSVESTEMRFRDRIRSLEVELENLRKAQAGS